ncbi:MAG: shikimate kinase [Bacteroidales bacterium]
MIVYLTGFMGSGKTTTGRKLAALAGARFVDIDTEIEKAAGKSISRIFSEEGEVHFRKTEYDVLRRIDLTDGAVIATGGGTPCYADNMDYMNNTGITVYLKMTPAALASRLEYAMVSRPLIAGLSGESLNRYISDKITEREPYYLRSQIIFEGLNADAKLLLEKIRLIS